MGIKVGDRTLASTRDAVGARVTLHTRNGIQMREVQSSTGFAGQSEYPIHFGIPDPSAVERITIRWPSGREQIFEGEQSRALLNRHVQIIEGSGSAIAPP